MKKRYYLSMLSLCLLMLSFDYIYFKFHESLQLFLGSALFYFVMYGLLNLLGAWHLFKPIDKMLKQGEVSPEAKKRVTNLTGYSTAWIMIIGSIYVVATFLILYLYPSTYSGTDVFTTEKLPLKLILIFMPSLVFVHVIFPAFIVYFMISDFSLELKAVVYSRFQILYAVGKKKIGLTLMAVFIVLGFFPTLLVTFDIVTVGNMTEEYGHFTTLNPLETILVDRFVVMVGMLIAVIMITRSFTKPIHSLLEKVNKVREGDFNTKAAIVTEDEIGVLTHAFNDMVSGLKKRELMRHTFGKYMTKDVATVILDKKINLEGELRPCTILVTDIANYTTISEAMPPKEIVRMLNEYFSVIVEIIQKNHGIVNKFIGDSVFAMFNVPLDDPAHALNAIKAALEIERSTMARTFGEHRSLKTRIGINTGEVVAGNIGSADRMEYTVIGDDVNIAARLEQLNKEYGTRILIGENTYELTKDHFDFSQIGNIQLKGKERTIDVYTLNELKKP